MSEKIVTVCGDSGRVLMYASSRAVKALKSMGQLDPMARCDEDGKPVVRLKNRVKVRSTMALPVPIETESQRVRRLARYEENRNQRRLEMRARLYGITVEALRQMEAEHAGVCACCGELAKLQVDHCHRTGAVRGLLCGSCNLLLGMAKDSTDRIRKALSNLQKHQTDHSLPDCSATAWRWPVDLHRTEKEGD